MSTGRVLAALATVLLVVLYASGSGWLVSTGDSWYRSLEAPPWQPPDAVFGLIWPYNFVVLIAAGLAVAAHGTPNIRVLWVACLAASITAALAWAWLFYEKHELPAAAIALSVAAVATAPIVFAAFRTRTWAGIVLVPYQVWVALAASLSFGYARLN
ncbi:MAG: tryptophan-rich sensory protein [Actinomycetia bacterium]|nr:tryptophan-rich sensory protein [Actinomycetes bacterium]